MCRSEAQKRMEILLEFVYYVFDSLLIPLIRSNFHVTESNLHRNRLFFFRHDVWRQLTEPSLTGLKLSMFEEIEMSRARNLIDSRPLGFSQIRLIPKGSGTRPIMNLSRRMTKIQNGKGVLGRSINSIMKPVFSMLDFEKRQQPHQIGSALFSVADMYPKLKIFRDRLRIMGNDSKPLYFIKVDVQSCFDSIPQPRVMKLIESLASHEKYKIPRHTEIRASGIWQYNSKVVSAAAATKKFVAEARDANDPTCFRDQINSGNVQGKKNTVFVDSVVHQVQDRGVLLDLLAEHIERNIVKIGKKFFRQKRGIPQGSILSSILCSFLYAELEREYLGFLMSNESCLLRLIDDFLLITINQEHARLFGEIMHTGVEKYGVRCNTAKSLTNFELVISGTKIPQLLGSSAGFPYCGNIIQMRTLEITKDRERRKNSGIGVPPRQILGLC